MHIRSLVLIIWALLIVSPTLKADELVDSLSKLPPKMACDAAELFPPYSQKLGKVELEIDLSNLSQPLVVLRSKKLNFKIGSGYLGDLDMTKLDCGYYSNKRNDEVSMYYVCDSDHPDTLDFRDVMKSELRGSFIFNPTFPSATFTFCSNKIRCIDLTGCASKIGSILMAF